MKAAAGRLGGYYRLRSTRQQVLMDVGSGFTFVTAVIAGFSAPAGQVTQKAWLGAAFVPIVLSQQNANEPTRDLYYAGELALQMVNLRYQKLHEFTELLDRAGTPLTQTSAAQCADADSVLATASAWPAGDDKQAILPEAQRISAACHRLKADDGQVTEFVNAASAFSAWWPARYRNDVLRLDSILLERDRDFRYTPIETMSTLLASPLRTVDFLLTGNDTQAAINQMKVQTAFGGMNTTITEVLLPALPAAPPRTSDVSAAAVGRSAVAGRKSAPSDKIVGEQIAKLTRAAEELQAAERRHGFRLVAARELSDAASADRLTFGYDVANRMVQVTLAPPVAAPTPLAAVAAKPAS